MPYWILHVKGHFCAAHRLARYRGDCASIHGHDWKVQVDVDAKADPTHGMLVDFKVLDGVVKQILNELDHAFIVSNHPSNQQFFTRGETLVLTEEPTAENIAKHIFLSFNRSMTEGEVSPRALAVHVWETDKYGVTFYG